MEENGVMGKGCILRDFRPRERISRISHDKVAAGCMQWLRGRIPIAVASRADCFPGVMV